MNDANSKFAANLVDKLLIQNKNFLSYPNSKFKIQSYLSDENVSILDLTPFDAKPQSVSAASYFNKVHTAKQLVDAYHALREQYPFEMDLPSVERKINSYSRSFVDKIIQSALSLPEFHVNLIANFVKDLDAYSAIKSVESLLNSKADIALLEVAKKKGWQVHFDHLAIRCGSQKGNDAAFIARFLMKEHGYVPSQVKEEAHYQFPDGWNAFPLYKILENGQILRVFVDQSDITDKKQIIQHWNKVYGYTAHHLALRATKIESGEKHAVPLDEMMNALQDHGITIMQPTGEQTHGLLMQVFTKPELNDSVPQEILQDLRDKGNNLDKTIKNGKLLEIVSREEMPLEMANQLFDLYGLQFDVKNPVHSAPIYTYFLPAQAAHVIKTSQTIAR